MSIKLVEAEIRRFLSTKEPEVICISGHWGVGKTFAWRRYLLDAQRARQIQLDRYSYVSLFGINSLEEFKYSIFENTIRSQDIGVEPSLETIRANAGAAAERLGRRSLWFLQQLPLVKNHIGGLGPVWFLSVKETIICIDDLERRGEALRARDILGLISALKEQRNCKIALIWNDNAEDKEKGEFERYHEKVVDKSLRFDPSTQESVQIALTKSTAWHKLLADNCISFGISNIRLIKRIERLISEIEPMVTHFDEGVFRQCVQSLTLLTWSIYEPDRAPALDYLRSKIGIDPFGANDSKQISEKEASWNALLKSCGFLGMDKLDLALVDGIRNGFFDERLVKKHASELDEQFKASKLDNSFQQAWELYHDSLDNNQDQVLDAIYGSFMKSSRRVSPMNLSSTVALFKALGRSKQAGEMIAAWVQSHGEDREVFDLRHYPFAHDVNDADVIQALGEKLATFKEEVSSIDTLLSMAATNGWNPKDITKLSTLEVGEYYKVFKSRKGRELRRVINSCLQFDRIGDATPEMKEISRRAKAALMQIGLESRINARRVSAYGVTVAQPESKPTVNPK
jgi:hypothetical protein